jgi:hypothetical protein
MWNRIVPRAKARCFNTTNLHSHGLWVSPTGNSKCCPKTIYGHFLVSTSISFDKDFDIGWLNGKPYELPRIDQALILVLPNLGVFLRRLCRIPSTSM